MKDNPRIPLLNRMRDDMYKNPEKVLKAREAADSVNYSYHWFTVCWAMQFGIPYHDDINNARAKHIKAMLKQWKKIPDIADALHVSTDTISRVFKSVYGMSIKKYMAQEVGLE